MQNSVIIQNVTPDDLKNIISNAVEDKIASLLPQRKVSNDYLTRQETASLLRISLPTLNDFTKRGLITGHRIGSRVLYSRDLIESSLKEIESIKYRRS